MCFDIVIILQTKQQRYKVGLVHSFSGNVVIQNFSHPLITQGSNVCGDFLCISSVHDRLEYCVRGHKCLFSSFNLCNIAFARNFYILQTHQQRCEVRSVKRSMGGVGVNEVIKHLCLWENSGYNFSTCNC